MKNIYQIVTIIYISIVLVGCDNSKDSLTPPTIEGLSASASSVILLTNDNTSVVVSNGMDPYMIEEDANGSIAFVQLEGRVLTIKSKTLGATTVKIKDSSTPAKTITIAINVVASYTTNTSGSLSFSSNRGNFSANGIGLKTNSTPASGTGVIALSEFKETLIYAYTVNSPTSIDIVTMLFQGNSNLSAGSYEYPSTGNVVLISYLPNVNPSDSLSTGSSYTLSVSAIANIETLTSSAIKGTFGGTGYFWNNGVDVPSQTINVTNGVFNVPVLKIGKRQENAIEKLIVRSINRL